MEYITHSPEETAALGARLAEKLGPGAVVAFTGDLGAGKSVMARGIARALGVTGAMPSPTFTLLIPYQRGDITSYLCENAQIFSMEYEEEGTLLHGKLEREDALRYGSFAVDPGEKSEE